MKKLIGIIVSGMLVLSMGSIAIADTNTDTLSNDASPEKFMEYRSGANSFGRMSNNGKGSNRRHFNNRFPNRIGFEVLSELTGKTVDEINDLLDDETKLRDIAEDEGVLDDFLKNTEEKRDEQFKSSLDIRLDNGTITQEQYDAAIEKHNDFKLVRGIYADLDFDRKANLISTLADITDKSEDELTELYEDKAEFNQFIRDENIYAELCTKVRENVVTIKKAYLEKQLENDEITKEQYDIAIEMLDNKPLPNQGMFNRGMGAINGKAKGQNNNKRGNLNFR